MKHLTLMFALTLPALLSACGGYTPVPSTQPGAVNGTITGYGSGAGSILLLRDNSQPASGSNPTLSSGPLASNGTFSLPLPDAATVAPLLVGGNGRFSATPSPYATCSGTLQNSNPSAESYSFDSLRAGGVTITSNVFSEGAGTLTANDTLWVYEIAPVVLSGSVTCTSSDGYSTTVTTTTALLRAGWNIVTLNVQGRKSGNTTNTVAVNVGTRDDAPSRWQALNTGVQSLDARGSAVRAATDALRKMFCSV